MSFMRAYHKHKNGWWEPTSLEPNVKHVLPKNADKIDPAEASLKEVTRTGNIRCRFNYSSRWVSYHDLESFDSGYIVPMYSIKAIGRRYGLSDSTVMTFKQSILPKPFVFPRTPGRRATNFWPKFLLMAMDVVLLDLEALGYQQFLPVFKEHVTNLHSGYEYITDYYTHKYEVQSLRRRDKFGVLWE